MAKTLKQLFKTQKLDTGTTGQAKYEIRNSKDTDITTANPLLAGTSFPLVNKLRKGPTSERRKETLLEEETTGLRPLRFLSTPVLYGTDIIRLTTLRTGMIDDMKSGANGGIDAGLYGNAINKLKTKALGLAGKLGIKFPQEIIPSRLKINTDFQSSLEPDTMATLAKIKGDAAGNLVGKFLAKNAKGTPEQIKNQAIGSAISLVKDEARKFLFGGRKEGQTTLAKKSPSQIQYDRKAPYSSTVDKLNKEEVSKRNDLSTLAEVQNKVDTNPPTPQSQAPYITKEGFGFRILSDGTKQFSRITTTNASMEEAKEMWTDMRRRNLKREGGVENPDGTFSYPPPFTKKSLTDSRKEAQQELAKAKGIDTATKINYGPRILKGSENSPSGLFKYTDYKDLKGPIESRFDLSTKLYLAGGMTVSAQKLAGNPNNITIYDPVPEPPQKDLLQEFRNTEPLYDPITGDIIQMPPENPTDLSEGRKEGQQILAQKIEKRNGYQYLKYESVNPYTTTIDPTTADKIELRNDLSSRLANFGLRDEFDKIVAPTNLKMSVPSVGFKYDEDTQIGYDYKFDFPNLLKANDFLQQSAYARRMEQKTPNFYTSGIKYSNTKGVGNTFSGFANDLSDVLDSYQNNMGVQTQLDITPYSEVEKNRTKSVGINESGVPRIDVYNEGKLPRRRKKRYSSKADDAYPEVESELPQLFHDDMLEVKIGDGYGGGRIVVNNSVPYSGDGNDDLSNADFATLRFYSVFLNTSVNFLATITALTENWTPSWESNKFIGNAFNFYTYESVERSVTFTFKVFSTDDNEHKSAWERLNFLSKLTLPQGYGELISYVQPPIIQLTMGDVYHKRPAFIETLSYTVDDTYTWDTDTPFYTLPKIINVDITLKLLLSKEDTDGKRLYDYGGRVASVPTVVQQKNNSTADSTPIKNKPLVTPKVNIPAPKITIPGTPPPPPVKVENPVVTTTKKPIPKKVKEKKPDPIVPKKENKYIQKVPQGPVIQTLTTGVAKSPYQQKLKSKIPLKPKKLIVFPPVKFGGGDFAGAGAGGSRRGDTRGDF